MQLQADLDSSQDGAEELSELRLALQTAETKLIESKQTEERLMLEHQATINKLIEKVCVYQVLLTLCMHLGFTISLNSMQLNCRQLKARFNQVFKKFEKSISLLLTMMTQHPVKRKQHMILLTHSSLQS